MIRFVRADFGFILLGLGVFKVIDDDILMIGRQLVVGRSTTLPIYEEAESVSSRFGIDGDPMHISPNINRDTESTHCFFKRSAFLSVNVPRT
jgi:hypothetical protein